MSIFSDAGLIRTYQFDSYQRNVVALVINKILRRLFP